MDPTFQGQSVKCETSIDCVERFGVAFECNMDAGLCVRIGGAESDCKYDSDCPDGFACQDQVCVVDPCLDVPSCGPGKICVLGECVAVCRIEGKIYQPAQKNPANDCLVCAPLESTNEWTPASAGTQCGVDEVCDGAGVCRAVDCDQDCSTLDDWYEVGDFYDCCDDTSLCVCQDKEYRTHYCVDNECEHAVTARDTLIDGCTSCDDGNECTENTCIEAACEVNLLPEGTPCGESGICGANGLCNRFCRIDEVQYSAGERNPRNECEICDPERSNDSWSPLDGRSCGGDYHSDCIEGICQDGHCIETPTPNEICGPDAVGICDEYGNCLLGCNGLSWAGIIAHGESRTAYENETVECGSGCSSQVRNCSHGELSGDYEYESCIETCPDGETCVDGSCEVCIPAPCIPPYCGFDGCESYCECPQGQICEDEYCVSPDCDNPSCPAGYCGPDGCGGYCSCSPEVPQCCGFPNYNCVPAGSVCLH